jgi:histidinol dehydrogenase
MALFINPIANHREREKGVLVYPVHSRRSGGLSVGINLFPDKKFCPFDCPYCEVFPFSTNAAFSPEQLEDDLRAVIAAALKQNIPIKDICFSGNGEPSLSPHFPQALELAARIRAELAPSAELVLITNGAGLLQPQIFSLLSNAASTPPQLPTTHYPLSTTHSQLNIWLKLDAGTPAWYQKMNRTDIPFKDLIAKIKEFTARAPVTIQTMLCAADGNAPPDDESQTWETLILELAATGNIRKVQLYGKARPAPEDPKTSPLPIEYLEKRAASLRKTLARTTTPTHLIIEVYN